MKAIVISLAALISVMSVHAQPTVITTNDASKLANALIGTGITIVGTPKYTGGASQSGTFTGGPASTIGFSQGILLTSGRAVDASASYTGQDRPTNAIGTPGDTALSALINQAQTFDAAILEFNFTSTSPTVFFKYTFASAEYPNFENKTFNDVFGFFVNGQNYATIPGANIPVSVNNLNSTKNSQFFRGYNVLGSPSPYGAQTVVLSFTAPVSTTGVNTIRLAIADTADSNLDSAVFIQAGSLSVTSNLIVTGPCPVPAGTQGTPYSGFKVTVAGGTPSYTYTPNLAPGLTFDPATGTISGTPTTSGSAIPISLQVSDSSTPKQTQTYSCNINIVPSETGTPSTPLSIFGACPVSPIDFGVHLFIPLVGSGGQGSYKWALTSGPSWLSLSVAPPGTNATLSGTPNIGGPFSFAVTLSDTGGTTPVKTFSCGPITVVIPIPKLQITSACPASPVAAGTAISQFLNESGGIGPYDWAVHSGSLPPGLQLSGGKIFGTPTSPGTYAFTISVYSADNQFVQTSCQLVVTAPALQLTSGCPGNGTQGVAYGPFPLGASGGAGPSSYVFGYTGNLPDGVSIIGNTIAGLPTKSGVFNFTPQVTSGTQTATRGACSVTIAPKTLGIQGTCPSDTQAGGTVSTAFSGVDGTSPYSYNFSGPAWLTQSNGTVSGKSAITDAGPASFTITVTDAAKTTQAKTCSFTVTPPTPPQITSTCPAPILRSQGSTLTLPLTATSGTPPYAWSYDNGEPDLSITSDSTLLTGILNKQGPFSFTISLTDNAGAKATPLTCSLTVGPPPAPPLTLTSSASCPTDLLHFGSTFSRTFSAGGGTAPYSWAVTPSDLFTLSPSVGPSTSLSGMLTRSGTIALTVTLNDNTGMTQTYPCMLNVKPFVAPTPTVVLGVLPQDITQPVTLSLTVSPAVPFPITGTVTLTFTSKATHPSNPPGPATLSAVTPFTFTIPAGSSTFPLPNIQRGKEYGTIHIAVTGLAGAGQIVPPATQDIEVPKLAPVFTENDVQINSSGSGFTIVIAGSSSTRDMIGGTIAFNAANGATVDGGTVDLGALGIAKTFDDWYTNAARSMNLTDFKNLTIPVTIEGDKTAITSVTVTLTNSGGNTPVTKSL